uniref:Alginate_exp domain-containing protein n=1 Tax=Heterorhabditis bacteriophora TaxID=37862 RepID=A0A1I7XBS6_HETBA
MFNDEILINNFGANAKNYLGDNYYFQMLSWQFQLFHKSVAMSPGMSFANMAPKKDLTWDFAFRTGVSTF